MNFKIFYFIFLVIPFFHLILFKIKNLEISNTLDCLDKFKSNNILGIIIFANILVGKLI